MTHISDALAAAKAATYREFYRLRPGLTERQATGLARYLTCYDFLLELEGWTPAMAHARASDWAREAA